MSVIVLLRIGYREMIKRYKTKKFFRDFYIKSTAENDAHMIDYQIPPKSNYNNTSYDGLYTIKNDVKGSSINNPFRDQDKIVSGFVETSGAKAIDLTSKNRKIYRKISGSFYHFIMDDISEILYALEYNPGATVILDVSNVAGVIDSSIWSFFKTFLDALTKIGADYKIVDIDNFEIIYINDFSVAETNYKVSLSGEKIYQLFMPFIKNKKIKPFRNVYVSRRAIGRPKKKENANAKNLKVSNDNRIDSHDVLEAYFRDLGYEIVVPETDFVNFEQQLNYFYTVKTLVSITSSGISNAVFMQPGGTIIEITTPLVVVSPQIPDNIKKILNVELDEDVDPRIAQEVHNFYKVLAYLKGHTYLSINNPSRSAKKIKSIIENDNNIKSFIDRNE
jgi:hypothetical protein